jgi:replicative DNA helicase
MYWLKEVIDDGLQRIGATIKRGERIPGIPTGFEHCDQIPAGVRDGELTVVAGRPGTGASLAVAFAEHWREPGHGALIFSPGMARWQIVNGMLCAEARIDVDRVRTGVLTSADRIGLTQAADRFSGLNLWIDDTPAVAARQLRRWVPRLQSEFDRFDPKSGARKRRLGLVVVDPLESMRDPKDERASMLKQVAAEVKIPIVAVSQASPGN